MGEALTPLRGQVSALTRSGSVDARVKGLLDVEGLGERLREAAQKIHDELWGELLDVKAGTLRRGPSGETDGEDRILIRRNVARVLRERKELLDVEVYQHLTAPAQRGPRCARDFLQACTNELDDVLLHLDEEAPMEPLELSPPRLPEAGVVVALARKFSDARRMPFYVWPYARVLEGRCRRRLGFVLDDHLHEVARALDSYLDDLEAQINRTLFEVCRAAARDILGTQGAENIYDVLKAHVGRPRRIVKDGEAGKKKIDATGMQLRVQSCVDAIQEVEAEQRSFFDAFTAPRDEGRNQYAEGNLEWGEATEAHLRETMELSDGAGTVEIYREASRRFLSRSWLLPWDWEKKQEQESTITERDALRELVERSMHPRSDAWKQVQYRLEDFCFEAFTGWLQHENAVTAIHDQSEAELDRQIQHLVARALPFTPVSPAGKDFKKDKRLRENQAKALLGIPPLDESQATTRERMVELVKQCLPDGVNTLQVVETDGGSLTLYVEEFAVPITYFGGLPAYAREYQAQMDEGEVVQCSRHANRHWEKYRDILWPHGEEAWLAHRDSLALLVEAFVTAVVRHSVEDGFHFECEAGTRKIGKSLDLSVVEMKGDDVLYRAVEEQLQERRDEIFSSKRSMLILLKCYQVYLVGVFPEPAGQGKNIRAGVIQTLFQDTAREFKTGFGSDVDRDAWEAYLKQQFDAINLEDYIEVSSYVDYDTHAPLFRLGRSVLAMS